MTTRKGIFIIICFLATRVAFGGGFQVNLLGAKQNGMAYTGTGLTLDASSAFFNPGGLAFLKNQHTVNAGVNFVFANIAYHEPQPGFYTARNVKEGLSTPLFLYANFRLKEDSKWNLGFSVNNPFGSSLKWEDDWAGQFIIREISLSTFSFQPTVGYKINDNLSVGAGLGIFTGSLLLRKGVPVSDKKNFSGEAELSGSAVGFGANIGLMYRPKSQHYVGLSYRSPVKVKLKNGEAKFEVPSSIQDSFPATGFSTEITLPQVISLGIGYQANDKWLVAIDVNYTGWHSYDTLKLDFEFNSESLEDAEMSKEFKSSFAFRIGTQFQPVEKLSLRAGAFYDMSPVPDDFISPDSPDADRLGLTGGLSYQPSKKFSIDAAVMYVTAAERSGGSEANGFYGSYKVNAVIPTIGLEILFGQIE